MNLRFAAHSIRVRVAAEEFTQLHNGKALSLDVPLPRGHVFRAKVTQGHEWLFDTDPTGMWLTVPHDELMALAADLPSKEGITHGFATDHGELQVSLEVDVKNRS